MVNFGLVCSGSLFEGSIFMETLTHHHLLVPRHMWSKGPTSLGYASQQRNVQTTGNLSQNINIHLWYMYAILCIQCSFCKITQSTMLAKCKVRLVHISKVQNLYLSKRLRNLLKQINTWLYRQSPGNHFSIAHLEKILIDDYHFIGRRSTVSDLITSDLQWINLSETWRQFWSCTNDLNYVNIFVYATYAIYICL